ncbi:hypothetical protein GCM10009828_001650 [Actinoplanes couchii]|uniref:Uncharacterized protein n=2 Tax=Actinoplanes couchii TaxID=403638 RepID=A0ABQ3XSZ0_9ACTN|nr:hypothetical protein Aco03nite_100230 [Actinoplanes couchii]
MVFNGAVPENGQQLTTRPEQQPCGPVGSPPTGGPDTITALVETVHALTRHFPDHNGPFERVSRLAEETGELAQQVNHAEGMGVKVAKHGPADPAAMVKELMDVLRAAVGLAVH